jgi:Ca2+-binding RTX toxin-like protein
VGSFYNKGDDVLTGGGDTDLFNFNVNNTSAAGFDFITDFDEATDSSISEVSGRSVILIRTVTES